MTAPDKPGLSNEEFIDFNQKFLEKASTKGLRNMLNVDMVLAQTLKEALDRLKASEARMESIERNASRLPILADEIVQLRKALEAIHHRIWRSSTSYQVLGEIDKLTQDALLTSKPEPQEDEKELEKEFKQRTIIRAYYLDLEGKVLWEENPYQFSRIWKAGQMLVENYKHYRVKKVSFVDGLVYVKLEMLTDSKPEPVAPVRKWEAEEVVGERRCANPDCNTTLHVFMHNLSPEVQDALRGRKAD